jgi:type I restriction enzyme, S subunit
VSESLPEGWTTTPLTTVVAFALGGDWGKDPSERSAGFENVRVIRGTDFRAWQQQKATGAAERLVKGTSLRKRMLRVGDVVLEVSGGGPDQPVGRTIVIDQDALMRSDAPLICSNFFRQLRCCPEVDPFFINYFLEHAYARGLVNAYQTQTTNLRNLNVPDFLEGMMISIAPLSEQLRIVAKIGALLRRVEACNERLDRVPKALTRFRQAVLSAACSGRLTASWREHRGLSISEDGGSAFPAGWKGVTFGEVLQDLRYGTATKCSYEQRGIPVLRIPNVANGIIDGGNLKFAALSRNEVKALGLMPGDILLIRSNGSVSLVGKSAIVRQQESGFAFAGYLIRLRVRKEIIEPEFLNFVLATQQIRLQIELEARSTSGVNNINSEEIRALRFNLPAIDEQREIIRQIHSLLSLADGIEVRYLKAKRAVDKLSKSILAKAFRGELVPNEAELAKAEGRDYESAEQLLARIDAQPNSKISQPIPTQRNERRPGKRFAART